MTTIFVPAPPESAFNKNRPVSDLLQHQLRHFQHIEAALPAKLRSTMTSRDITTENGAAQYIAHLTGALRSLKGAPVAAVSKVTPIRRAAATVAIAAAGEAPTESSKAAGRRGKAQPPAPPKTAKPRSKRP